MPDLMNCPNCGKVFIKALRPICDECYRDVENKFEKVYKFIRKRENRRASMDEVHEGTGVSKDLIVRFIREGRLHLSQFPNLGYPCEKCGVSIREGRLCKDCAKGLQSGLNQLEREKDFEGRKLRRTKNEETLTYHTFRDERKK
ncbi:TIGR03826 family flagellar region protein [Evansella cellulosilytica]|uniref:Flagellar operon protein YvyF n=1 Tax=Evansella cellulosilytica (strain ATCC 21833 / DSM 2522 / FERM P-1141 / JCM 9156 / N-4) TaxID=649639 RepID=E6TSA0_EVAC2|nr:TIGR03826 family flagellar region protein [Evansella cellulosilytica]ADU31869.1 Flagellar operon protein YvyF [Evansella cellulosilytica DSM 2522]